MTEVQAIRGHVTYFRHQSATGWGVASVRSGAKVHTMVGEWPLEVRNGDLVEVIGTITNHPHYGEQFAVARVVAFYPCRDDATEIWLADNLPNIGPERAKAIVQKFGADLWTVLEERPERLLEVPGVTKDRLAELVAVYAQRRFERDIMLKLLEHGLNGRQAATALKRWGQDTMKWITDDPYILFSEGMADFVLVDAIATRDFQVQRDDPRRVCALLESLLQEELAKGNTLALRHTLLHTLSRKLDLQRAALDEILAKARTGRFQLDDKYIALSQAADAEANIAKKIGRLLAWTS